MTKNQMYKFKSITFYEKEGITIDALAIEEQLCSKEVHICLEQDEIRFLTALLDKYSEKFLDK